RLDVQAQPGRQPVPGHGRQDRPGGYGRARLVHRVLVTHAATFCRHGTAGKSADGVRRHKVHSGAVAEGGYGVHPVAATIDHRPVRPSLRTYAALAAAGFRRYATYRQATLAAAFTNSIFGFLRCYVLLSPVAALGGSVAGYSGPR